MSSAVFSELAGKRAIVTGGAGGIGLAIASALVRQNVTVTICDINIDAATAAAKQLGGYACQVDVRRRESVEAAVSSALEQMGGCDILIANAGVSTMQHALDLTDEEWDFNFDVNIRGVFLANQIVGRRFKAQGHGVIVNTASLAANAPTRAGETPNTSRPMGATRAA